MYKSDAVPDPGEFLHECAESLLVLDELLVLFDPEALIVPDIQGLIVGIEIDSGALLVIDTGNDVGGTLISQPSFLIQLNPHHSIHSGDLRNQDLLASRVPMDLIGEEQQIELAETIKGFADDGLLDAGIVNILGQMAFFDHIGHMCIHTNDGEDKLFTGREANHAGGADRIDAGYDILEHDIANGNPSSGFYPVDKIVRDYGQIDSPFLGYVYNDVPRN
ncbi:MAG: hypothetical protein K2F99_07745 [Muribaculaceae bacterium]|nr:hypothetical protein [Muribaculaceae bacterium]